MSEVVLLCSLLQSYRLPHPLASVFCTERLPLEGLIDYVVKLGSSRTIPRCLGECGSEAEATSLSLSPFFCGYVSAVVDSGQLCVFHPIQYLEESRLIK